MYKLTIYMKYADNLVPVYYFYSEDKRYLENRAQYHMSLNPSYVSILVTYRIDTVETLNAGDIVNGDIE